jgi:sugar/nucleoside kinase (ribokinase family)
MVDVCVRAPALAGGGDVPGSVVVRPGGAAANVAVWARAAGAAARVVARRGTDLAGELLAAALAGRGVELHPPAAPGPTGAMLVVWESDERSFVSDPGANAALRTGDVRAGLAGADAVHVSGYALLRPGSRRAAMAAARSGGTARPAAVDASSWPLLAGSGRAAVLAAAASAGALLANAAEAAALTGARDPERAAVALAGQVPVAVVKLGPLGVLVAAGGRLHAVDAGAAVAVDPTGAGDALAAGFLVARAGGADPVEAARAGVELAASAVAVEGAWPPGPWPPAASVAATTSAGSCCVTDVAQEILEGEQ